MHVDLNVVVDYVIPMYTVLTLFVLYSFIRGGASSHSKKFYTFVKKESAGATPKIYSLKDFIGTWKQETAPKMEDWFTWKKRSFAVRLIAPTQFLKMRHTLEFTEENGVTMLDMLRDMGTPGSQEIKFRCPVADKAESAVFTQVLDDDQQVRAWFDAATGAFTLQIMDPKGEGPLRCIVSTTRTIDPFNPNNMTAVRARCIVAHIIDPLSIVLCVGMER